MKLERATNLKEIMKSLQPSPLTLEDLPDFFEETSDARDPHLVRRDDVFDRLGTGDNVKILLTGHAGCGKSTELTKFQEEHGKEYAVVSFSLIEEAQLSQASIEVLLVLIVDTLVKYVGSVLNVKLSEDALKSVYDWFSEAFDIKEKDLRYEAEAGIDADTRATFWGRLLGVGGYIKADIKSGSNTLHRKITKENRRLSELAYYCGLVVKEARLSIREQLKPKRDLLLVIEDLDKVPIQAATEIFIQNPAPIAELPCKAIYTAPLSLLCSPRSTVLDPLFKKVTVPMIKTEEQDGRPSARGVKTLKDILARRMDLQLIEENALDLAIQKTGGVLRHLFDALTTAASTASQAVRRGSRSREVIGESDVRYGLDQLRSELVRRIGVLGLPEEYRDASVTVEAMYDRLRELSKRPRRLESDPVSLLLLQAHAVIEYNGQGWHRVHPLIAEHLETRP